MPKPDLSPYEKGLIDQISRDFTSSENKELRDDWTRFYRLYRSFRELRSAHQSASSPRGRDVVMSEARGEWGQDLLIPIAFATVETILPRMLSNRPKMLIIPRGAASEHNVQNMKWLIDSQQSRITYENVLRRTAKSGLVYGLGVQKVYWCSEQKTAYKIGQGTSTEDNPEGLVKQPYNAGVDDPEVEDVDIFDFFWDRYATDINRCRFVLHRTWRDTRYVMDKFATGQWQRRQVKDGQPARWDMTAEEIDGMASSGRFDETVNDRLTNSPTGGSGQDRGPHEVWEYWDAREGSVCTVLDREIPVNCMPNPYWHGELPFVTFRPSEAGAKQLAGIGEVEPIEELSYEMNILRRQRRDNAALVLNRIFAYTEGWVDEGDILNQPGGLIPIQAGEPRNVLFPIETHDIPNSGYQEEANLLADIERTSGISETVSGTGDASQTATGVQLVQAAANVRIQSKTRVLESETIKGATRLFISMNQQHITENREFPIPAPPEPGGPERRWTWVQLGPTEIMGEFDCEPEGGSTAPENVPQMRADAQIWMQLMADPGIDGRMVREQILRLMGVKQPESWVLPDDGLPESFKQAFIDIMAESFGGEQEQPQQNGDEPPDPEEEEAAQQEAQMQAAQMLQAMIEYAQQIEQQQAETPNLQQQSAPEPVAG